jgi:flagellar motility protein MotE (MotC chaperone)
MEDAMRLLPLMTISLAAVLSSGAFAQEDRYVLEKSGDGFVRMDRKTGEMSTCTQDGASLVCKLAADERTAYQDEIDRLQQDMRALDERVARLENSLTSRLESTLPSEEEFQKGLGYMERFLRSFRDTVQDLDKQPTNQGGSTGPDKT